jgi:hypothetical protein
MTGTRPLQTRGRGSLMRSHRRAVEPLQAVAPGPVQAVAPGPVQAVAPGPVQAVAPTCFRCHSPVRLYSQTTL